MTQRLEARGFWDNMQAPGEITGSGPNFERDMARFKKRQEAYSKVGTWRAVSASWTKNDGPHIDPDWYIVDQGHGVGTVGWLATNGEGYSE